MGTPHVSKGMKTVLLIGSPEMEEGAEYEEEEEMDPMAKLSELSSRIAKIEKELGMSASDDEDEDDDEYKSVMYG